MTCGTEYEFLKLEGIFFFLNILTQMIYMYLDGFELVWNSERERHFTIYVLKEFL